MDDHLYEIMELGETYVIRSGEVYYTLHRDNYWTLHQKISDWEYGMEFIEGPASGGKMVIEISNNGEFVAKRFVPNPTTQRVTFPDRNRGSFLPYTHILEDEYVEEELAKYGLWKEVKEENYTSNCLIQALIPSLEEEVIIDLKQAVRNSTCLLYTSPSPRDRTRSRMPSSA